VKNVKIPVSIDKVAQLQAALHRVNGQAYARVALAADVIALAEHAEASLADRGIPTRERAGTAVVWCDREPAAKSYGYKRTQTAQTLVRGTTI
jgi:hypothetical protein